MMGAEEEAAAEEMPMIAAEPEALPPDTEGDSTMPELEPAPTMSPAPREINPFVNTVDDNLSTFALDVDTASYSAARNAITNGMLPDPGSVRVEEFVNYFDYGYPQPENNTFNILVDAAPAPWASVQQEATQVVRVGLQGMEIDSSERDDAVLTFVIDISGSMGDMNRLPLVKEALTLLVEELRPTDQVAIVVYSDQTRAILDYTPGDQKDTILNAINALQVEGSTNVEDGLRLGYEMAASAYQQGSINRVILCSDGVANVGETGPDAIRQTIRDYTAQGVLLTTVGFGMGDYNDVLMEQLADDGNGNYAYVDTIKEARRIFVEELTGTLQVIAKDAKVQVEFNPDVVSRYRLLGYENRNVADEDFRNDKVDAGEVGAGHSVTAIYEVVLTEQAQGDMLTVFLRYQAPQGGDVTEQNLPFSTDAIAASYDKAPPSYQLAVAVSEFAEQLRQSGYAQERSMGDVLALAEAVAPQFGNNDEVQEFVELVRQATTLN